MINLKEGVEPDPPVVCDKCGKPMVIKAGKFGLFLACSGYPECENTRELETPEPGADGEEIEEACENCGKPMAMKRGRFGQFLACTGYPECKTTRKIITTKQGMTAAKPDQILDEKCPKCESNLVIKQGRFGEFTACSNYPACKYVKQKSTGLALPERRRRRRRTQIAPRQGVLRLRELSGLRFHALEPPVLEPCPQCGEKFLIEKITKRHGRQLICQQGRLLTTCGRRNWRPHEKEKGSFPFLNAAHPHHRRRAGWQRGGVAGGAARRARRPPRDAAGPADRGPQDGSTRRAGVQQFVPRRQAR